MVLASKSFVKNNLQLNTVSRNKYKLGNKKHYIIEYQQKLKKSSKKADSFIQWIKNRSTNVFPKRSEYAKYAEKLLRFIFYKKFLIVQLLVLEVFPENSSNLK